MHIDPGELDFDDHPLNHRPGDSYCRSLPGGWRVHLHLTWEYRWKPALLKLVMCSRGLHDWCPGDSERIGVCHVCINCWTTREL